MPNYTEGPTVYIFLDEAGNFDFSSSGSKYFTLACTTMYRPFRLHSQLDTYKYNLIEFRELPRIDIDHFHCALDNKHVRAKLFSLLAQEMTPRSVDAVVIEKSKTGPALQAAEKFYPKMIGYLLRHAVSQTSPGFGEVVIITDSIPVARKKNAVEKAIKKTLTDMLNADIPYRIMHHPSRAHYGLQIVDYMCWAIHRKWERGDDTAFGIVSHLVRSEFDIFQTGVRHYY